MSGLPHKNFYYVNSIYRDSNQNQNYNYHNNNHYEGFTSHQPEDVFVMFYAPWCGHCKSSKPAVQQALGGIASEYQDYMAGQFQKHGGKVAIVMVNGDEHPEITKKFGVQGFPTFKLLKGVHNRNSLDCESVHEYDGGRSVPEIDGYLQAGSLPNSYEHFASPPEDAFVMFYAPWCGHCKTSKPAVKQAMGGIASEFHDYRAGKYHKHSNKVAVIMVNADDHPDLIQKFDIGGFPTFKYLKNISSRKDLSCASVHNYNGNRTSGAIERFIQGYSNF